jgi:hypothetical protein
MALVSDGATLWAAPFPMTGACLPLLTFFCWMRFASVTGSQDCFDFCGLPTGQFKTGLGKNSSSHLTMTQFSDAAAQISGATTAAATTNTWYAVCGTATIGTSMTVTSTIGANTASGSITISTWNQVQLLASKFNNQVTTNFMTSGSALAECAVWTGLLGSNDINALVFEAVSPWKISRRPLIYIPLRNSFQDYGPYKLAFTSSGTGGTTFLADHPITEGLSRRTRFPEAIAGTLLPGGDIGGGVGRVL